MTIRLLEAAAAQRKLSQPHTSELERVEARRVLPLHRKNIQQGMVFTVICFILMVMIQ